MKNLGALGSSVDSTKLSTTVSGLFMGGAVLIVLVAQWLGFTISTEEVTTFGVQVGATVATLVTIYGVIRKVAIALQQKFS